MRFKGKSSIWKYSATGVGTTPKSVDTEFKVFRPNLSTNPDGPPILECRTKKTTHRFKLTFGCCEILCPPNISDKITLQFKQLNTYVLISSIAPEDQRGIKVLAEHFSKGIHKNDPDKIKRLLHNPFGAPVSSSLKPESKQLVLIGEDAKLNFQKRQRFNENLQSLTLANQLLQLDGRIFVLENLQELRLENIGLNDKKNQSVLTNLCRLSNLKILSFANNGMNELSNEVLEALPVNLQHLILVNNRLTILPRQLKRCTGLVLLDARCNSIASIHEDISKLRNLQIIRLEKNCLRFLPYSMFYGRRFGELNLTDNPNLFSSSSLVAQRQENSLDGSVPKLKYLTMASMFNFSEHYGPLLPTHIKAERDSVLHICFMCMKYVPIYGSLNFKYGQFDIRESSSDVYYNQAEISANYVAYVCLNCKPNAIKLKIFS